MKKFLIIPFSLVLFSAKAQNEDSVFIRRIADQILVNGKAYDDLRVLTKQVGGRVSGSPQMVKAEQWGLQTVKALQPDNAWLQECMVPHWVRGGKDVAVARYNGSGKNIKAAGGSTKPLDVIALGNSIGTGASGVTAEVIEVKNFDELEQKKNQIQGKIVFYNYPFNQTFVRTFLAYSDAVRYRGQGPSRAAKYGALAVIVRSMSESTDNAPHSGSDLSVSYFDVNAGLFFNHTTEKNNSLYFGASMYHITRPKETFLHGEYYLDPRVTFQAGGMVPIGQYDAFHFSAMHSRQANAVNTEIGGAYMLNLNQDESTPTNLFLGSWFRFGDAIIPYVGLEFSGFQFGFTYDVNVSSLKPASNMRGGAEISLIYIKQPADPNARRLNCPRF